MNILNPKNMLLIIYFISSLVFADTSIFSKYESDYTNINKPNGKWSLDNGMENVKSPYTLLTGSVIQGVTISHINSDTQGMVTAQVSQNIYDSVSGNHLLIPSGTKIVGIYGALPAVGTTQLAIMWNRLIFPNGQTYDIGNMPLSKADGSAGGKDRINNHLFKAYANALLMTLVTAGVSISTERNDSDSNRKKSATDSLSEALGQQLGATTIKVLENNLNVSPTIEIRSGYLFNIIVVKDITFDRPFKY